MTASTLIFSAWVAVLAFTFGMLVEVIISSKELDRVEKELQASKDEAYELHCMIDNMRNGCIEVIEITDNRLEKPEPSTTENLFEPF